MLPEPAALSAIYLPFPASPQLCLSALWFWIAPVTLPRFLMMRLKNSFLAPWVNKTEEEQQLGQYVLSSGRLVQLSPNTLTLPVTQLKSSENNTLYYCFRPMWILTNTSLCTGNILPVKPFNLHLQLSEQKLAHTLKASLFTHKDTSPGWVKKTRMTSLPPMSDTPACSPGKSNQQLLRAPTTPSQGHFLLSECKPSKDKVRR